jgi:hypothetical protein
MGGAVPPLPNMPSWRGAQLGEHRDFTLLFYFIELVNRIGLCNTECFHFLDLR